MYVCMYVCTCAFVFVFLYVRACSLQGSIWKGGMTPYRD